MIKYFKELDNRENYYLPLVDIQDHGKKEIFDYQIPLSFIEKYSDVFKTSESLVNIYKNFDIDKWFHENMYIDYENACSVSSTFESINEEMHWILEDYKEINVSSKSIECYFNLIKRLSLLFTDLFPKNKSYYDNFYNILKQATEELSEIHTISYVPDKRDNIYQPNAWFITPNGYLYNPGRDGHKSRDFTFLCNRLKCDIMDNEVLPENKKTSKRYLNMARDIEEKGYITAGQFKTFLNYISQPVYLDSINGIPITREKHIVDIVVGIIMAHSYFYDFFEEFINYVENPKTEINKLSKWTDDDIVDILVRCCGFHKVETNIDKTITTSCINYEVELEEYIKRDWTIQFIPPIIINKENGNIEENSQELTIRRVLKKY